MNRKLINSRIYLLVLPLIVLFVFNGKKYDAAVIDRIIITVRVCIQGEDCGAPLISASDMLVDSKGTKLYAGCIACHGTGGEGGIGPSFTGRSVDYISAALIQYKNKEERGPQSVLMYAQAAALSDNDIQELSEYIITL